MTTIGQLSREGAGESKFRRQNALDPLTARDGLEEADIVAFRLDASESRFAAIFDLRQASNLRFESTALLIARGVSGIDWTSGSSLLDGWVAHKVSNSRVASFGEKLTFECDCYDHARLKVVFASADFVSGDITGLAETPPDFGTAGEQDIADSMPSWGSPFEVKWAITIGQQLRLTQEKKDS